MKNLKQWLSLNKGPVIGFIALMLNYLDSIFHISARCNLPQGWHFTVATVLLVVIGFAIKGNGIRPLELYEELMKVKEKIEKEQSVQEQKEIVDDIINKVDEVVENKTDSTNSNDTT